MGRFPVGLIVMAALATVLVIGFDLNKIASIGSAVALLVFSAVSVAHLRLFRKTGANVIVLVVGLVATLGTFVVFCTTTLIDEPATAIALIAIIAVAVILDFGWKAAAKRRQRSSPRSSDASKPTAP